MCKNDADKQGRTPLILATQNNHLAVVQYLEEEQPMDTNEDDLLLIKKGQNTLCAAAERGAVEAVRFLLEEGVSKDDADKDGWTPLMTAAWKGHFQWSSICWSKVQTWTRPTMMATLPSILQLRRAI